MPLDPWNLPVPDSYLGAPMLWARTRGRRHAVVFAGPVAGGVVARLACQITLLFDARSLVEAAETGDAPPVFEFATAVDLMDARPGPCVSCLDVLARTYSDDRLSYGRTGDELRYYALPKMRPRRVRFRSGRRCRPSPPARPPA